MPGIFAIRTDASATTGSGHIRRMTILARYLNANGFTTLLLCGPETEAVLPALHEVFHHVQVIHDETEGVAALAAHGPAVAGLFFDHYGLGADTHRLYRGAAPFLAAIDDMANRPLDVDMLFDVNLGRSQVTYDGLVPDHAEIHVGSHFQIINPMFFDIRDDCLARRRSHPGQIERLFIAMGGTDPFGMTIQALDTAAAVLPDTRIDVVAGSMTAGLENLRQRTAELGSRVALHVDSTEVAELMCHADLAIGAGGTMTWERNCLGLPSVVLVLVDNQEMVGAAMAESGGAIVLDAQGCYPAAAVADALRHLARSPQELIDMSRKAARLSGRNGAELTADILTEHITGRPAPTDGV